jgi:hypothetical protein
LIRSARCSVEAKEPRAITRRWRIENQHSIWLSHEACLGVKCRVQRGCSSSQAPPGSRPAPDRGRREPPRARPALPRSGPASYGGQRALTDARRAPIGAGAAPGAGRCSPYGARRALCGGGRPLCGARLTLPLASLRSSGAASRTHRKGSKKRSASGPGALVRDPCGVGVTSSSPFCRACLRQPQRELTLGLGLVQFVGWVALSDHRKHAKPSLAPCAAFQRNGGAFRTGAATFRRNAATSRTGTATFRSDAGTFRSDAARE